MPLVDLSAMRRLFPTIILLLQIILRLEQQINANKQTLKSQYLDSLQKLMEAQTECFSAAIADRKKILKDEIEHLRQRIATHHAQLTKVTKFQ